MVIVSPGGDDDIVDVAISVFGIVGFGGIIFLFSQVLFPSISVLLFFLPSSFLFLPLFLSSSMSFPLLFLFFSYLSLLFSVPLSNISSCCPLPYLFVVLPSFVVSLFLPLLCHLLFSFLLSSPFPSLTCPSSPSSGLSLVSVFFPIHRFSSSVLLSLSFLLQVQPPILPPSS